MSDQLKSLNALLRKDPDCAWALFYRAGLCILLNKKALAAQSLAALDRVNVEKFSRYPELSLPPEICSYEASLKLDSFLKENPMLAWGWALKAMTLRYHMRYQEALPWMALALRVKPQPILYALEARFRLNSNARQTVPPQAIRHLKLALKMSPKAGWIHCWLGEALRHQKKLKQALQCLNRGLAISPLYSPGRVWRGAVLRQLGYPKKALADLDRAINEHFTGITQGGTDGLWAWGLYERHLALRALGRLREAAETLLDAHELNNRYQWGNDFSLLDRAVEKNPKSAALLCWRGFSLLAQGRADEASRDLSRALELAPDSYFASCWLGVALKNENYLQRSIRLKPDYALALIAIGKLFLQYGRIDEAIHWLDRACAADAVSAPAFAARGEAKARLGLYREALKDFESALRIYPGHKEAAWWHEKIGRRLSCTNKK